MRLAHGLRAGGGSGSDPYFNHVSLLLHGDGTNGAQNNTFIDSSANNFTVTRVGNATQGTFSPYSNPDGYWGTYLNGSSYLQHTITALGTGDFTIECWIKLDPVALARVIVLTPNYASGAGFEIYVDTSLYLRMYSAGEQLTSDSPLSLGVWTHIAYVRQSSVLSAYINGVRQSTRPTWNGNITDTTNTIGFTSGGQSVNGWISNLRWVVGTAVYTTASFIVPTSPLTAIANTQLLTCQSNRHKDNSGGNRGIAPYGAPNVSAFSPFAPTAEYSASINSGSLYFDGNGDAVTLADNNAWTFAGDFTVECWVNIPSWVNSSCIVAHWNNTGVATSWALACGTTTNRVTASFSTDGTSIAQSIISNTDIHFSVWTHFAVVRSGTTITLYQNGVSVGTATISGSLANIAQTLSVGNWATGGANFPLTGYVSNLRIVNGTAVYTSAFTPPTSPLTAITNTQALLLGTNAGIIDFSKKVNLETVSNAQISTTTPKFGTGAITFNGSTDYLLSRFNPALSMKGDSWTVETWFKSSASSTIASIYQLSTSSNWGFALLSDNGKTIRLYISYSGTAWDVAGAYIGTFTDDTWGHIAVVKQGTTVKGFFNGVQSLTLTGVTSVYEDTSTILKLGFNSSYYLNGKVDDVRFTQGIARYNADFSNSLPTTAFPNR